MAYVKEKASYAEPEVRIIELAGKDVVATSPYGTVMQSVECRDDFDNDGVGDQPA